MELQEEVEALDRELPEDLKGFYQRSAKALKGVVVVPIKDKTCGFCHMIIPLLFWRRSKKAVPA